MNTQTLNISLPKQLVALVDEQAKQDFSSRSDFIRKALVNQLRSEQSVAKILDGANARGRQQGITGEQQAYDALDGC